MKLPSYAIKESFFKLIKSSHQVKNGAFLLCGKCPLCQDWKTRMYLKEYPQRYVINCHNCGYSKNYLSFLRDNFPSEVDNLKIHQLDFFKSGEFFKEAKIVPKVDLKDKIKSLDFKLRQYVSTNSFSITEEQTNTSKEKFRKHCLNYVKTRKIDESVYLQFLCFFKGPLKKYLGIPFFDESGSNLLHIQGRRMFTPKDDIEATYSPKYKFLKDSDAGIEIENKPIWGLWRIDSSKTVMMCEGTLDAPAFDNAGATCGASISLYFINEVKKKFKKIIWCIDNFWLDKKGKELTTQLLSLNESCFIIPKELKSKDANELLKELNVDKIPMEFVLKNVYTGKLGLFTLNMVEGFNNVPVEEKKDKIAKEIT